MADFVTVAKTSEVREGRGKAFTVNGKRVAVFNDRGEFYALSNICAHARGPLARGRIRNGVATCPVHGYAYDAKTGSCQTDSRLKVNTYEIVVEGDEIKIRC